ncbi:hypothetical protein P22_0403 [Propionispora sp. 2/2-37]|uniref:response regulator transcription factor n=1 Tax=Propionispora sp. 2/2-37 TaxID=1677858 RepID=UPI0006BB5E8A|nr:response regulator [Propionispora sp. 2/2-37]CUH94337.1 hypothetical protein P22_0403 [Propionispora sp. 2/2-37]
MVKLMIVDDEQLERQALRLIIERNCPDIEVAGEAGDGVSAVQLAIALKPDIVIMDIRMPEMNGLHAAQSIKQLAPDTSIVMLTAFDEFAYAKQALQLGAMEYLLKPVRPEMLLQTLQTVMQRIREMSARRQEEARLREQIAAALPFIQMSFVYDLISGQITEMEHFKERAGFLGLQANPAVALVVDVDRFKELTRSASELEKQVFKQQIYRLVVQSAGKTALVTPFGSDSLVILLHFSGEKTQEEAKEYACRIAGSIQETVFRDMKVHITVGIGRCYEDPRDMYKSYHEALSAQRQRFYLGDHQIIHIEDVPFFQDSPFQYPFQYERTVMEKVRCGDRRAAKAALRELLQETFSHRSGLETVKAYVLELLIVLSRSAVEGGANLEQLTLLNFTCIQSLTDCATKEHIEQWMMEYVDHFMDNMLENRSSVNTRLINSACEYILKNFQRNILLEEVAQTVHLSPFYFSRLFKKEKGYNFADFVTRVRLERAKKLLQNQDYTVVRIASEVGYQDASYFCRAFRKACGMTPNQYRSDIARSREEKSKAAKMH